VTTEHSRDFGQFSHREREGLRQSFLPRRVQLLFIGESPPASGRFFYSANSGLYRAMRMAFQIAGPGVDDENFLAVFQQRGCYLTDLCPEPVDRLDRDRRLFLRTAGEKHLARQIKRFRPAIVAPVLRSIAGNVRNAALLAAWDGPIVQFPYPGRWSRHREVFTEALVPIIRRLKTPAGRDRSEIGTSRDSIE
jgi:hypothetical protein